MNRKRPYRWRRTLWALAASTVVSSGVYADNFPTATPIKHIVVIFDENITFDHYFATYPHAANPPGEPAFVAADDTPSVNGLGGALLTHNPNGANPARLDRSQAITCSNNHSYTPEQAAVAGGLLDNFAATSCDGTSINLNYFDGNTVTALWNYAQHFAMNDNSFETVFGPSTVGAINLISGQTHAIGTLLTKTTPIMISPATYWWRLARSTAIPIRSLTIAAPPTGPDSPPTVRVTTTTSAICSTPSA